MVQMRVHVNNISAERFLDAEKPIPNLKIGTNINLVKINKKEENLLEIPFVFTANYTPLVAKISLKGEVYVRGSKEELKKIQKEYKEGKLPLSDIVQSVSNVSFIESVIVCRSLNIPPPMPLPKIPEVNEKKPSKPTNRT